MKNFFPRISTLLMMILIGNNIFAEGILINEDFTETGYVDGDLIIINGNLDPVADGNDLVINGDLKIVNGYADVIGSGQSLTVYGDVTITNTNTSGVEDTDRADLRCRDDLIVYGDIYVRSANGSARVYSQEGAIKAGNITAHGKVDSVLDTESYIDVKGDITLISDEDEGYIRLAKPGSGYLHANNITVSAFLTAGIEFIDGHNGGIEVPGDIYLMSLTESATINVNTGNIYAGSITTSGKLISSVYINDAGDLVVRGPIKTYSQIDKAEVHTSNGHIVADYIYVDAYLDSNVIAYGSGKSLKVKGDVFVKVSSDVGGAGVFVNDGDLYALNITASGGDDGYVGASGTNGNIDVAGSIVTYGKNDNGWVNAGNIKAGEIFTYGRNAGYVFAANSLIVKGPIVTESYYNASVRVLNGDLEAEEIFTYAVGNDAFVEVSGGDLNVRGDIFTKCDNGDAYIDVTGGNLYARSIRTEAPSGDDYISVDGTAEFEFIPREGDALVQFGNSEFHFNSDQTWNTQLELSGSCTFNGDGMMLTFGDSGSIYVKSGASLLLNNIVISGVGNDMIRCEDDTATVSLQNVTWTLTDDVTFTTGRFDVLDCFILRGNKNLVFHYTSAGISSVADHASLILDHGVTFSYDSNFPNRLQMQGAGSSLVLNKSTFVAGKNCTLGSGNLFTNGLVKLDADISRVLDLSGLGGIYVNGSLSRGSYVYLP